MSTRNLHLSSADQGQKGLRSDIQAASSPGRQADSFHFRGQGLGDTRRRLHELGTYPQHQYRRPIPAQCGNIALWELYCPAVGQCTGPSRSEILAASQPKTADHGNHISYAAQLPWLPFTKKISACVWHYRLRLCMGTHHLTLSRRLVRLKEMGIMCALHPRTDPHLRDRWFISRTK